MCLSHSIYTVRPCLIHTCHSLTMPFFSRPRHSTAVERRPVGYLPAFGFFQLPRRVPRRFLSEAYQSSSQRSMPTTVKSGISTLHFGYFRLPRGLSRRTRHFRSREGARHGVCELRHDMAGERHGHGHAMCESALKVSSAVPIHRRFGANEIFNIGNSC
jgi:hypothetical protein